MHVLNVKNIFSLPKNCYMYKAFIDLLNFVQVFGWNSSSKGSSINLTNVKSLNIALLLFLVSMVTELLLVDVLLYYYL